MLTPLIVEIEYNDGNTLQETVLNVLGNPSNPLPRNLWLEKFQRNWQTSQLDIDPNIRQQVIQKLENLETEANAIKIMDNLFLTENYSLNL